MATNNPQRLYDTEWHSIQAGPWSGSIQNVGNAPVVGCVTSDEDGAPDQGRGGFAVTYQPEQIAIEAGETLYCRATATPAVLVLA